MQKKITKNKIQKPGRPRKVLRKASGKKGIHRKIKEIIAPKREFGLHNLKVPKGSHKRKKILGRGSSSGHGKTSTRGSKGQTSRAGRDFYPGFEGGQTSFIRRMPKRGFVNRFKKIYQIVNLKQLNQLKEPDINLGLLEEKGLIKDKNKLVKILGEGEIKNPISIQAHAFSKKAAQTIKNAGGKAEIINA